MAQLESHYVYGRWVTCFHHLRSFMDDPHADELPGPTKRRAARDATRGLGRNSGSSDMYRSSHGHRHDTRFCFVCYVCGMFGVEQR